MKTCSFLKHDKGESEKIVFKSLGNLISKSYYGRKSFLLNFKEIGINWSRTRNMEMSKMVSHQYTLSKRKIQLEAIYLAK